MKEKTESRTAWIKLRVAPTKKDAITAKAKAQGQTVTDFIRQRAMAADHAPEQGHCLAERDSGLREDKAALEATVAKLSDRTWGLKLLENQEGRFIVLPPKATPKTGWTMGKQQAVKLE